MNGSIHRAALAATIAAAAALAACSSSTEKQCQDFCGQGAACVGGACVAVEQCTPACTAGNICQDSGGVAACVPLLASACPSGCAAGALCVAAGGAAECVSPCGAGEAWSTSAGKCVVTNIHALVSRLDGPFAKGEDVTAACLTCHATEGDEMLSSAHFNWTGPTPGLVDASGVTTVNPGTIGKKNIINDFCVATPTNEGRCGECHAGYADLTTKKMAYQLAPDAKRVDCLICHADLSTGYVKAQKNFGVADVKPATGCSPACSSTQVCLKLDAGLTCVAPGSTDYAAKLASVLSSAAHSVRKPGRDNCGKCHFYAGGGDNVKMGDLASSLANPASAGVDVHMASTTAGAPTTCADCHADSPGFRHDRMKGTGLSVAMVKEADLACTDCHASPPASDLHSAAHLAVVACQTCHIPAFSRQLATKTSWDWSVAGYKDCKYPGAADELVAACDTSAASPNFGTAKITVGDVEIDYSWQKGVFRMEKNVKPAYRWYDGRAYHQTITGAMMAFDPLTGTTSASPVSLSEPVAVAGDPGAKITPFKRMQGRQAVMKDGSFVPVPHVFGMWSLWGTKPDPTVATSTTGAPMIPVVPGVSTGATSAKYGSFSTYAAFAESVWNDVLSFGAASSGQLAPVATATSAVRDTNGDVTLTFSGGHGIPAGGKYNVMTSDPSFAPGIKDVTRVDGNTLTYHDAALAHPAAPVTASAPVKVFAALLHGTDWEWGYTEMFMNVNHEVAPKAQAIATCSACHSGTTVPVCDLYQGASSKPNFCPP